ncbi:MAG: cysteine-rich CWC family protein [Hydrogenophaga sp.]|uniref:cysteine-rich CWC family protein n=1 Tax=Hydrogenophaga sp. TaxID=1904254 RepID=UPI003D09FFF3
MPTPTPPALDPTRCPLCGGDNRCALEIERETGVSQPPCWCMSATFLPALLEQVPEAARGQACVCAACVAAALEAGHG